MADFQAQWVDAIPWWYAGVSQSQPVPSTNNSLESQIKYTRRLAGGVPAGLKQLGLFMLARVTAWSDDAFDPLAERPIPTDLWLRARAFAQLVGGAQGAQHHLPWLGHPRVLGKDAQLRRHQEGGHISPGGEETGGVARRGARGRGFLVRGLAAI